MLKCAPERMCVACNAPKRPLKIIFALFPLSMFALVPGTFCRDAYGLLWNLSEDPSRVEALARMLPAVAKTLVQHIATPTVLTRAIGFFDAITRHLTASSDGVGAVVRVCVCIYPLCRTCLMRINHLFTPCHACQMCRFPPQSPWLLRCSVIRTRLTSSSAL